MIDIYQYDRFHIPGFVWLEQSAGDLPLLRVHNRHADCSIYPYGAHIAAFRPKNQGEVLWVSPYSSFEEGKPIRGGIPICFPWFGRHRWRNDLPLHGFVRTRFWDMVSTAMLPDGRSLVVFALTDNEETRSVWPFRFRLELAVTVGETLEMTLLIENRGEELFTCEEGFHTYFHVEDPARCEVHHLDGVEYIDRVKGDSRAVQSGAVRFDGELVNAYMHAPAACELTDFPAHRRIRVEQKNMDATVIWNPGAAAAAENPEIRDAWDEFVCVESTNCLDCRLEVPPGASHRSLVRLGLQKLQADDPLKGGQHE